MHVHQHVHRYLATCLHGRNRYENWCRVEIPPSRVESRFRHSVISTGGPASARPADRGLPWPAAAAALEQLKAAGVRTIFHTNTSGYAPLWDAVYSAGDVQVIMKAAEPAPEQGKQRG